MKFKLDENLPVSAASVLGGAGHDVDTVRGEHLAGRPDLEVVAASTAAGRVLISLDVGPGDSRACPPGSHTGIVILRVASQFADAVIKAIRHLASLAGTREPGRGRRVLQRGLLRIGHPWPLRSTQLSPPIRRYLTQPA